MGATAMIAPQFFGAKQAPGALQQLGILPAPVTPLVLQAPPNGSGPSTDANDANSAAARARRKVAAGEGQSDTSLTGPRGLGEIGGQNLQIKTLLGY